MPRSIIRDPAKSSPGTLGRLPVTASAAVFAALFSSPLAHADDAAPKGSEAGGNAGGRFAPEHYIVPDSAHLRYTLYPGMKATSAAPASLENLSGDLHEADAQLVVPITENEGKTTVLVGLGYTYTHYQLSGLQAAQLPAADPNETLTLSPVPSDLHAITATLGISQRLSRQWSMLVSLKPGIYSDLRVVDAQALSLQGLGMVSYHVSDKVTVGLGFSYQSRFGTPLLLPVLQLNWYIGAGFRFFAVAPDDAELLYQPSDRLVFNLFGRVAGGSYRIHPSATLNQVNTTSGQTSAQNVTFSYDLAYSTISAGAGARFRFFDGLYAFAEVPLALSRRWDATNLCWASGGGQTQCMNGPTSVSLANVNGKYSVGVSGGVELRF